MVLTSESLRADFVLFRDGDAPSIAATEGDDLDAFSPPNPPSRPPERLYGSRGRSRHAFMTHAFARPDAGKAVIVPVLLRPCLWKEDDRLARLQAVPRDLIPVTRWPDADDAWVDVAQGIRQLITN